jgi:mortality factor 4-like protein 1
MFVRELTKSPPVTLPELIAQTNMDQQSCARLREELHLMTAWLCKETNLRKYFSTPYENTTAEYQELVSY